MINIVDSNKYLHTAETDNCFYLQEVQVRHLGRTQTARTFFARMNEGRNDEDWMSDAQLLRGTEEFLKANNYDAIEYGRAFLGEGVRKEKAPFVSPIMGSRAAMSDSELGDSIAAYFKSKINRYDMLTFGRLESILYDIVDNYENTALMLVTDSLSYAPITKVDEISVALENLMGEGLYLLFLNKRFAYALFDDFMKLTAPIPLSDQDEKAG